jgi:ABC-type branched-subunit amino acid transport system ATPase component
MNYSVEARGLTKDFGTARALDGATFTVETGESFGLLGPNGAGKPVTGLGHSWLLPEGRDLRRAGRSA